MHDWTFLSISVDWETGGARLEFSSSPGKTQIMIAHGVTEVHMPRKQPWGPSVSVNRYNGPNALNGVERLSIEMQSGDEIVLAATKIEMPAA